MIKGLGVALITPFCDDHKVDYQTIDKLVDRHLENHVDFLCILATTAETPCLTASEQAEIHRRIVERVDGKMPIVMGFSGNNTMQMAEQLKQLDTKGIDALLIAAPFYNRPTQEGLYLHYKTLAEATTMPVILYNVPSRTGVNIEPETVVRIARSCPSVIGIKEASGNKSQAEEIIRNAPSSFAVFSGDDVATLDLLRSGAVGAISVVANALPHMVESMIQAYFRGEDSMAEDINNRLKPLYELLFKEGNPTGIKALMAEQKQCRNILRLPLTPATEALQQKIGQCVAENRF